MQRSYVYFVTVFLLTQNEVRIRLWADVATGSHAHDALRVDAHQKSAITGSDAVRLGGGFVGSKHKPAAGQPRRHDAQVHDSGLNLMVGPVSAPPHESDSSSSDGGTHHQRVMPAFNRPRTGSRPHRHMAAARLRQHEGDASAPAQVDSMFVLQGAALHGPK